jgi:transcriptional regulator GlxA family with amidase domain
MSRKSMPDEPLCFGFLLVPNLTVIGFASAIEPLRFANMASGRTLYRTLTITRDGQPVEGRNPPKLRLAFSAWFQCHELVRLWSCLTRL